MYTKIFSILDKCVVDKDTRDSLKQAFNCYEEDINNEKSYIETLIYKLGTRKKKSIQLKH